MLMMAKSRRPEESEQISEVISEEEDKAEESAKKPKKKGFFGKLIDGLTKTKGQFCFRS